jgi:hypothetical protein
MRLRECRLESRRARISLFFLPFSPGETVTGIVVHKPEGIRPRPRPRLNPEVRFVLFLLHARGARGPHPTLG